jgi:glycosyltransferase involved in cell wall biosynthesis
LKKVAIVYRFLPQYRVDFFEKLRRSLQERGIDLQLIYGRSPDDLKKDTRDINWATPLQNREWTMMGRRFYYQPIPKSTYESDLIILMQETRILSNYTLLAKGRRAGKRLAFWGHGINFQDDPNGIANKIKRKYSTAVDWWFAYTEGVKKIVARMDFPESRITVVQNAIDTENLRTAGQNVAQPQLHDLRRELRIGSGPVGIFCGGMYSEKRLPFLFEACKRIRTRFSAFQLILIGAGPDQQLAEQFVAEHTWAHYVGPKFGKERVPYFLLSDVFLIPGLVGLAILDAFALGTPIITTEFPFHSPEIEYLSNGDNGIITANDLDSYVAGVSQVLSSPDLRRTLAGNGFESAKTYTVDAMVNRFVSGITAALAAPLKRTCSDS